jgi:hypothetical protein
MLTEERVREIVIEELQKLLAQRGKQRLEVLKLALECPDESIQYHSAPPHPHRI